MANNKLAIIGGSGLYDVEEFTDRELVDFMRELFDKFKNNEIDEEILESLVQETMEEFGRRNYMHAKRSLH